MKKIILFLLLLLCSTFCFTEENEIDELFEIKAEINCSYPIFIDVDKEVQGNAIISPMVNIQMDFPVYNNFGVCVSGNFSYYSIKTYFNSIKFLNLSALTGVYYQFELPHKWTITPDCKLGFTWIRMDRIDNEVSNFYSIATEISFDFAKQFTDYWSVYATTTFGYYYYICPVSAGLGFSYIVE